jgi:hypothetical protein
MQWVRAFVVVNVELQGDANLFEVVDAFCGLCFDLGRCQRRKEHGSKDRDDGNDDEEFNQCESMTARAHGSYM